MSWLTNRVQTARRRDKNNKKQAKGIFLRLRQRVGNVTPRFLSGAFNAMREPGTSAHSGEHEGRQL